MRVAYWNRSRFVIEHDDGIGWYLYIYEGGKCVRDYLQDTEHEAKELASEDYDVAFRLWHEEEHLPNIDQSNAYVKFLGEIRSQLCDNGAGDIFLILEGVTEPTKRIAPLSELLSYIESNCHVRSWGDRAVGDLGYDWWNILDKVRIWSRKLQQNQLR